MARDKRKQMIIIAAVALIVLVSIATVALMKGLQSNEQDPYKETDTSSAADTDSDSDAITQPSENTTEEKTESDPSVDPSTLSTIDIAPLSITASYVKGVGAVEYQVLRTPNGTQYVEFRSPELVGTKCTGDEGAFASILADPKSDESATLAKSITVDGVKYGLSLAADSCTSDASKLKAYQDSFSSGFNLLKKME